MVGFEKKYTNKPNTTSFEEGISSLEEGATNGSYPNKNSKEETSKDITLFQVEELPPKEKIWRETKPNPRFNRVQKEESEDLVQKGYQHLEEKTLMEITAAMDDDEGDQNLAYPNSLASYQSGLLEAMLVEQECKEGSSSTMETSAIASNEAEVKGGEEQEQSCGEKPSEGPLEIIEISSSEELEAWEEMQESKEAQMMDGDYDILILTNETQDNEATSKEIASFAPNAELDLDSPLIFTEAEMYKPEIVPLSELTQATTHPTNEMDSGELIKLKAKLKQAVSYESDTPTYDAWM
ncbi:hypothetical protein RHGRI_001384 [Rhododendron griersonianum]|uniref:Uncharacterized protein n=1 Tax=Rhododendron griersonianum TaxID=479676 RepID=A0AAV6LKI3_9ERIC|nr:hypothetical protein RHGRI_001384 [Rhododendron griersonianum]